MAAGATRAFDGQYSQVLGLLTKGRRTTIRQQPKIT